MTALSSARTRSFDGSAVAVATSVMNVATYGFAMLAFDVEGLQESAHDQAMAEVLLAHRKQAPGTNLVVLTGNVHASTKQGVMSSESATTYALAPPASVIARIPYW